MPDEPLGKMRWKCRRGMLELDVILLNFFEAHYTSLTAHQQQIFSDLLNEADPSLYNWFLGYSAPEDKALAGMVDLINRSR